MIINIITTASVHWSVTYDFQTQAIVKFVLIKTFLTDPSSTRITNKLYAIR